ncbi:acetate--CoA ligase family protein [Azospirillum sp. TSA6c]|uniref:acetate--CoA ligase family protein n=1 Tax=unclassified Azospirillum TaxID=2630922 RepID=UPI000D64BBE9|nr:acetate--CoA ligase family protein [Azospirillum sp. TSA6c]
MSGTALKGCTGSALAEALLRPRTVALVGVSDDIAKTAARPLRFLRRAGYGGAVYSVNPTRATVQGEPAFASLSALPERPDHAFILTGTDAAIAALEECGRLGVPVATILAGGFSEAGGAGIEREKRLAEIGRSYGVRVLGPSSIGVVNVHERLVLTANAAFAEPDLPEGGVFVASHSGSLIGAMLSRGKARGVGFAGLVSVGGEVDLSVGEICEATLDDPKIGGYLLFLESMRNADALRRFALAAAERGKPVAAYKLGRSAEAAELAVSHTGALAGEDDVADTFLRDCGIARVESFDGLLEIMPLLNRMPVKSVRHPAVGVVTTTGGGAAMAIDQLAIRGVRVAAPSPDTVRRLAEVGIVAGEGRLVDLTLAGTRYDVMKAALGVMQTAPEFDLVLATVGSSARFQPDLAVAPVIDSAREHDKPLAAFIVPEAPEALLRLSAAGVPCFRAPESGADVIAAAFNRRVPRPELATPPPAVPPDAGSGAGRPIDEAEAYRLFARVGVPHAPVAVLTVGEPVPELPFAYPVVAKVLHPDIAHKTDVGGVVLNVADAGALSAAMAAIRDRVEAARPGVGVRRILVQPMTRGVGEVLVGLRRDPQVGPVVMLAAGGVLTEIYRDRALRLAPVDRATALEMIGEVKALQALAGYRGRTAGDLGAVADALVAVSRLALLDDVTVLEAEINPLMVMADGQGAVAVDALVQLATADAPAHPQEDDTETRSGRNR